MQNDIKGHRDDGENSKYDYALWVGVGLAGWPFPKKRATRDEKSTPRDVPLVVIINESLILRLSSLVMG